MPFSISASLTAGPQRTALLLSCSLLFKCASEKKNMIRTMSGQWIWETKPYWHIKDFRMGKLELFWSVTAASGECVFFFLLLSFFSSQCVRDGCGSDASLFSLRIRGLASYQHELPRTEKLISMLNSTLEGGPWRKGRDCYFHCCTLWQSFGSLRSKSWELVRMSYWFFFPPCQTYQLLIYRLLLNTHQLSFIFNHIITIFLCMYKKKRKKRTVTWK